MDGLEVLRKIKPQDKQNKNRKYGRNGRTAKHRVGTLCSMKNCRKLQASRYYDNELKCYMLASSSG